MKFICQIGNCKRNKRPSEFATFEELMAHINLPKWQHAADAGRETSQLRRKKLQAERSGK